MIVIADIHNQLSVEVHDEAFGDDVFGDQVQEGMPLPILITATTADFLNLAARPLTCDCSWTKPLKPAGQKQYDYD